MKKAGLQGFHGEKEVFAPLMPGLGNSLIYRMTPLMVRKMGRVQNVIG